MSTVNPYSYSEQYERILMMEQLNDLRNRGLLPRDEHVDPDVAVRYAEQVRQIYDR